MDKLIRMEQNTALLNPEVSNKLAEFERAVKEIKAKQDELKQRILAEMEEHGILKIDTDQLTITYVAPTSRETFDSKAFRKDNPDLYDEYVKISTVSASVRMKVKECTE
jgi:regulator of replication initiation timing